MGSIQVFGFFHPNKKRSPNQKLNFLYLKKVVSTINNDYFAVSSGGLIGGHDLLSIRGRDSHSLKAEEILVDGIPTLIPVKHTKLEGFTDTGLIGMLYLNLKKEGLKFDDKGNIEQLLWQFGRYISILGFDSTLYTRWSEPEYNTSTMSFSCSKGSNINLLDDYTSAIVNLHLNRLEAKYLNKK